MKIVLIVALFFSSLVAQAQDIDVEVKNPKTFLYDAPNGKQIGSVSKGRRLKAQAEVVNGYRKLHTKSGRALWVRQTDVVNLTEISANNDLVSSDEADGSDEANNSESSNKFSPKLTYDIGFSTGSSGGESYSEANLGLNLFFKEWLAWRNALFARFVRPENLYGLDTSLRLFHTVGSGRTSLTLFGGPGWRFVTKGLNPPFAEAGLVARLGGFSIGGGAKTFFNSAVKKGSPSDTQYFIILSGGGSL